MPIFSLRLAGFLMLNGHPCQKIKENTDGTGRNVYYFVESPALHESIERYLKKKNKNMQMEGAVEDVEEQKNI